MSQDDEHYIVNWHADESSLDPSATYRIRVLVGQTELGHADVEVVESGRDLRNVDTGDYIPLLDGRTLPIKFRVEYGAIPVFPPWCTTLDFTGNMLPADWTMTLTRAGVGLLNDRIEAHPVDGIVEIETTGQAPAGLSRLVVEYDGLNGDSFWGVHREFLARMSDGAAFTVSDVNANYNFGRNVILLQLARLRPGGEWTADSRDFFPFDYGAHHYRIEIGDEEIHWSVTSISDNALVIEHVQASPGLVVANISSVKWQVYTTDIANWGDNLRIECIVN